MATSIDTAGGTWATIPMGRLDEALNTFWQLFYRPPGATSWSDHVEATATATNGGLVLTSTEMGRLIVGIRPSDYLTFTPLIATSDRAKSWTTGLIAAGIAARPDALAVAGARADDVLALVDERSGAEVLESDGDLSTWKSVTSKRSLALGSAGRDCGIGELTAVGSLGREPLVGASCERAGVVGIFARVGASWHLAGPTLPASAGGGPVGVLSLQTTSGRTSALLDVSRGAATHVVAAWAAGTGRWTTSAPLVLAAGDSITSIGPAATGGLFVLTQSPTSRDTVSVARPSRKAWQELPSPPPGTSTVAFDSASSVQALVGRGTTLTVWTLDENVRGGPARWVRGQVLHVTIEYGSSSQ